MRLAWWQVDQRPGGWRVRIHDLRYSLPGSPQHGIGYAEVFVPPDGLQPGRETTASGLGTPQ